MKDIQTKTTEFALAASKVFTPNLCLYYCYLYCVGIEFENEGQALYEADRKRRQKILDNDGTVLDAVKLLSNITGRKVNVTKKEVSSISEIKEKTPVRFDYNGKSHWVVVANGEIVFNSIENSVCVKNGKPTTARIIEWK